mgnify:CR=1 FL=1
MQKHLGKLINISIVLITCSITMANDQFDPPKLLKMGKKLLNSDPVKAVSFLERAYLVRYPKADIQKGIFKAFHAACNTALKNKNYKQLSQIVDKALKLGLPKSHTFTVYLMMSSHDKGDYNRCIDYANLILKKDKNNDEALFFRGKSRSKLKSYKKAIQDLQQISSNFDSVGRRNSLVLLGEAYYHRGDFDLAISTLKAAQNMKASNDVEKFLKKVENDKTLEEGYITSKPSPHFVIRTSKNQLSQVKKVLDPILERSFRDLTQIFDFFAETPITIVVYDPKKRSMAVRMGSPSWAAGVYDGEIRIPYSETLKPEYKLETLLRHELSHLFLDVFTHNSVPTWFNEGLAQYYEKPFIYSGTDAFSDRIDAPISNTFKQIVSEAISAKKIMPYERISGSFSLFRKKTATLAYAQSLMMFKYLIESHGLWRLRRMLRSVYQGKHFDVAFQTEFQYQPQDFINDWVIYQKSEWKLP